MDLWIVIATLAAATGLGSPALEAARSTARPATGHEPAPTPPLRTKSVVVTVLGPLDRAEVQAALEPRLSALGVRSVTKVAEDLVPPAPHSSDRRLRAWIVVPAQGPMRVVVFDPDHAHPRVRTIPVDGVPTEVQLDRAAAFIERTVASARAMEPWPAPPTPPAVHVEPASRSPRAPRAGAAPPSASRDPWGPGAFVSLSAGGGVTWGEGREARFAVPAALTAGHAFGRWNPLPSLRIALGGTLASTTIRDPNQRYLGLQQLYAESWVGAVRGLAWGYGVLGVGTGAITSRGFEVWSAGSAGIQGKLGAGVALRLTPRLALRLQGDASGNAAHLSTFAVHVGITGYARGKGARR